jgi:uncharacterized protein YbjT (DUF2867 family)
MTTLVIGARGSVGRHVVDHLLAAGEPVRASVRSLHKAVLPAAVSVVEADLTRPETIRAALDGISKIFLYAPEHLAPSQADAFRGLDRVVLLSSGSVLLPTANGNAIAERHRAVEQAFESVIPIRPLVLASNALNWARSIRTEGVVRLVHPDAMTAPIHERDIAAVATAALLGTASSEVSSLLTGPRRLSQREQVAAIDPGLRVEELSEGEAREQFGRFETAENVEAILHFIREAAGGGSPVTKTAENVLGRPPVEFREWVRDHAEEFR